jgi:hypothetical protein
MERSKWSDWEAQQPTEGFADRVVRLAVAEPVPAERRRWGRIFAGLLLAAALGAVIAFGAVRRGAAAHGDAAGVARQEVRVGTRAVAVLEPGAHVAWDGDVVTQDRGDVFWRVEPGARFVVRTPAGEVAVKGTCFRVKVIAGAGIAAAAMAVVVYEGKVGVSHAGAQVDVVAGESAETDDRGVRRVPDMPDGHDVPTARAIASAAQEDSAHALARLDRARADRMREAIRTRLGEARAAVEAGVSSATTELRAAMPTKLDDAGNPAVDPTYIRQRIHEDLFPLARQCYEDALARKPRLGGKLAVYFRVVGDRKVGGVVDDVKMMDDTTLDDVELQTCVKESMMSVSFDAPPNDGELTVVYPILFSPDELDAGSD